MNKITPITTTIFGNEKVWDYLELHQMSPDKLEVRRYRIIFVNRNGNIAEYRESMGAAKLFKGVRELRIPGLWQHTVDELLDLADYLRNETAIDLKDWLGLDQMKLA